MVQMDGAERMDMGGIDEDKINRSSLPYLLANDITERKISYHKIQAHDRDRARTTIEH